MEDLADDWMRKGQKPAYSPITPLPFRIARVVSSGPLFSSCICVPSVSSGMVKQQSIAPAPPPATTVRHPPFCGAIVALLSYTKGVSATESHSPAANAWGTVGTVAAPAATMAAGGSAVRRRQRPKAS
jgi:hypothetical protein